MEVYVVFRYESVSYEYDDEGIDAIFQNESDAVKHMHLKNKGALREMEEIAERFCESVRDVTVSYSMCAHDVI